MVTSIREKNGATPSPHLKRALYSYVHGLALGLSGLPRLGRFNFRGTSLIGFLAQSVGSSNAIALDSSYLLVLITGASQSRQHVDTSLIHIESRKPPTKSLFDVGSRRISIVTVNTKEYHSDVLAIITRIKMRRRL
ncbi:hypothetical protein Tco_0779144 [Tanacetum coccineum]